MNANLEIKCRPIFKGKRYSDLLRPVSWTFSDMEWRENSFFRLLETQFSSNPLLRLMYMNFGLISNHALLFRAFFLLIMESISELRCKPIFFNYSSSWKWMQFFRLMETDFLSSASFRRMEADFLSSVPLFQSKFVASGNHYQN